MAVIKGPSISPEEILFLINPHSGRGKSMKVVKDIKALDIPIDFVVTENKEAAKVVFQNLNKKYKGIVLVGGDGTINEAIKYLLKRPALVLGAMPFGSGNGFSREMNFDANLKNILASFFRGEYSTLDVLKLNDEYAINVSGIGIDSYVAHHFQKSKRRGFLIYVWTSFKAVMKFKDFEADIQIPGKKFTGKYRMISIANTKQFGNNAKIAPTAKPDDGEYELVLVSPFPFWAYPKIIFRMFRGKLQSSKYVKYYTLSDRSQVAWNGDLFHLDGEPKKSTKDLKIELMKGVIKIIKP